MSKRAEELIDGIVGDVESKRSRTKSEASYPDFYITLSSMNNAWNKIVDKLDDVSMNGPLIEPIGGDNPFPYDASVEIKGSDIILEGGCDDGGYGYCLCKYPKGSAKSYFKLVVEASSGEEAVEIKQLLDSAKIKYVEK